jgi:hypothetical protein
MGTYLSELGGLGCLGSTKVPTYQGRALEAMNRKNEAHCRQGTHKPCWLEPSCNKHPSTWILCSRFGPGFLLNISSNVTCGSASLIRRHSKPPYLVFVF